MEVPATQDQPRSTMKKVDERTCGSIGTERRRRSGPAVEMLLVHGRSIRVQRVVEWRIGERGREMKLEQEPPGTLIGGARTMEPHRQGTNGVRSTVADDLTRFYFGTSFSSEHKLARR